MGALDALLNIGELHVQDFQSLGLGVEDGDGGLFQVEHHAAAGNGQGTDFRRIGRQGVLMDAAGVVGVALVMIDVQHHQKGFGFRIEGHAAALFHLAKFARGQTEAESQYQSQNYVTHSHVLPPYAWRFLAASSALAP